MQVAYAGVSDAKVGLVSEGAKDKVKASVRYFNLIQAPSCNKIHETHDF